MVVEKGSSSFPFIHSPTITHHPSPTPSIHSSTLGLKLASRVHLSDTPLSSSSLTHTSTVVGFVLLSSGSLAIQQAAGKQVAVNSLWSIVLPLPLVHLLSLRQINQSREWIDQQSAHKSFNLAPTNANFRHSFSVIQLTSRHSLFRNKILAFFFPL